MANPASRVEPFTYRRGVDRITPVAKVSPPEEIGGGPTVRRRSAGRGRPLSFASKVVPEDCPCHGNKKLPNSRYEAKKSSLEELVGLLDAAEAKVA